MTIPSSQAREDESKSLLSTDQFRKLISGLELGEVGPVTQVNSYFDTEDLQLNHANLMLRIRERKGKKELTLKEPLPDGGRLETNQYPEYMELEALLAYGFIPEGDIKVALSRLSMPNIYRKQGDLVTHRIEIPFEGCKLALDHNEYLGREDWEIEMERDASDADEVGALDGLLAKYGIPRITADSKVKRFMDAKEELSHRSLRV